MTAPFRRTTYLTLAVLAAGVGWLGLGVEAPPEPTSLSDNGIGPLYLGQAFKDAESQAFRVEPQTAFSGIGCSGLDEVRYEGRMGNHPVGIMAMAQNGRVEEIEASLFEPKSADSLEGCRKLRDDFAGGFIERFGPYTKTWEIRKPVSRELVARTGPVIVMARWFGAGKDCYVSAHFGPADGTVIRPEMEQFAGLD